MIEKFLIILFIPLLLIVFLIVAIVIRLGDKGNVFFIQDRIGFRGTIFKMVKFRTMKEGTDRRTLTLEEDERITPVGKWLRITKLDELPQVLHVLTGEMSLIGPRPVDAYWNEIYQREIPQYIDRHNILPGITGLAQIKIGYTNTIAGELEKFSLDLHYIKYLNWRMDFQILQKTIVVIIYNILESSRFQPLRSAKN